MNKRDFLKTTGAFLASSLLPRVGSAQAATEHRTNWAGNYTFHTDNLLQPKPVEDVQNAVITCHKPKALGPRPSSNGLAHSTQNQNPLKQPYAMKIDKNAHAVTVGA